ncbi:MAG: amidohydrolase family protein [Alphaproteobacteria bacterium]|nr:amidohydrolase family protein [Alphaproteobacteria bacterium]
MKGPKLVAPAGACDTHMHFYDARYPTAPTALGTQPDATPADYRKVRERLGLQRVVVVQPSAYGADNRATMAGAAAFGRDARAVVVVERDAPDAELKRLADAGAAGLRFFLFGGNYYSWPDLERMACRAADHGWHLQLQFDGRTIPDFADRIRALPCDYVIDHNARFVEPVPADHASFKALQGLLDTGRCWVKCSGMYDTSKLGPPLYPDVGAIAKAIIRHAPERVVWASNWPHPGRDPKPDDAMLLDTLLDYAPDDTVRRKILVDNPARLYRFA